MDNQANRSEQPSWMSGKCVFLTSSVCFGILSLLSIFVFAPVANTVNEFDGKCILFGSEDSLASPSLCSYCIAIPVIFFLLCVIRMVILILRVTRFSTALPETISLGVSVCGVHFFIYILDILLAILLLVTASLLSAGLSYLCDHVFGGRSECSEAKLPLHDSDIESDTFYDALTFAEGSVWFMVCFWLLIVCVETIMSWKNGTFTVMLCRRRILVPAEDRS